MSRDYCFTAWEEPKPDYDKLKYIIWGKERCPTTDRKHYQGYAVFTRTHRIPGAKRIIGGGDNIHIESRRGTRQQARDYCAKDGDIIEHGRLEVLTVEEILNKDITFIKENYPLMYVRYFRGIAHLKLEKGENYREIEVYWLWGEPGTGKTRQVMEMEDVYKLDYPYKWWDGYEGEKILLLDDIKNTRDFDRNYLLQILDGYKLRLECKGSHTYAKWKKVYITSNYEPEIYDKAILRRITKIINVTSDNASG